MLLNSYHFTLYFLLVSLSFFAPQLQDASYRLGAGPRSLVYLGRVLQPIGANPLQRHHRVFLKAPPLGSQLHTQSLLDSRNDIE